MTVGELIYSARVSLGISQNKLAKISGVKQQLISRYETGKVSRQRPLNTYNISFLNAAKLARALNLSLDRVVEVALEEKARKTE